jgi:ATP synthase A1 C subunit
MTVSKYAYVYARIRARMSELMDERRLRELVDTRSEDFLSSLMDTTAAYKAKLAKAALVGVEARKIEKTLKEDLIDQYLMVIESTEGAIRDVFVEFLRRLEVKNLKAVIRTKAAEVHVIGTGTSTAEAPMFFPVEDFFKRRMSRLTEADSIENVIKQVENPYKWVLEDALPEYEKSKRVLVLENVLDEEIAGAIREKVERLSGADKGIARKIVGAEFDIANLMILLRCKSEGIAEAEIREYLLPGEFCFDFNLDVGAMNDSISAENVSSAVQLMPASAYKEVLTDALSAYEAEKSLVPLENALSQYFLVTIKSILRGCPINIGTIIGFLYLKEIEIKNLCTIAVCKENEIPAEETMKMVMV